MVDTQLHGVAGGCHGVPNPVRALSGRRGRRRGATATARRRAPKPDAVHRRLQRAAGPRSKVRFGAAQVPDVVRDGHSSDQRVNHAARAGSWVGDAVRQPVLELLSRAQSFPHTGGGVDQVGETLRIAHVAGPLDRGPNVRAVGQQGGPLAARVHAGTRVKHRAELAVVVVRVAPPGLVEPAGVGFLVKVFANGLEQVEPSATAGGGPALDQGPADKSVQQCPVFGPRGGR